MTGITRTDARHALASAQKSGAGVPAYLRWVNRPLGGRVAVEAAVWGLTPNMVTAISAALGFAGIGVLIVMSSPWAGPLAALLLLACYVFDSADGQLARILGQGGPAGEWLDHVVDAIRAPLVHLGVAAHLARRTVVSGPDPLEGAVIVVAVLFSALVSAWFLSQILAEKLAPSPRPALEQKAGVVESFIKQPQDSSTTYIILALLGFTPVFAVAYGGLFIWQLLVFAVSLRRKYTHLRGA